MKCLVLVLTLCFLLLGGRIASIRGQDIDPTGASVVNVDGSTTADVKPKGRQSLIYKKRIDADAVEREWQQGDEATELQQEQEYLSKLQREKKQSSNTATDVDTVNRIEQINKDDAFVVPVHAYLKDSIKKDAKVTDGDIINLGVRWRQRLMSAGISVGFEPAEETKILKSKSKDKKKKKKTKVVTHIIVVHVDKGWQVQETVRFLLKQSEVSNVVLDKVIYTQNDLSEEDKEDLEDGVDDSTGAVVPSDKDGDDYDDDDKEKVERKKKNKPIKPKKKKQDSASSEGLSKNEKQPHSQSQPQTQPQTASVPDPLQVNFDPFGFGNQIYVELKKSKGRTKAGKSVPYTQADGNKLADKWRQMLRTTYPGTEVTNMGPVGPPPQVPVGTEPPEITEKPGMTIIIKVDKMWMTYDCLKFALLQKETDKATVNGKAFTKRDLPDDEEEL